MSDVNRPATDPRRFPFPPAIPVVALLLCLGHRAAVADRRELARLVPVGWMGARDRIGRTGCFSRPYVSTAPHGPQSSWPGHNGGCERSVSLYPQSDVSQPARPSRGWHARVSIALGCDPLRPRVSCAPIRRHRSRGSVSRSSVRRAIPVVSAAREAMVVTPTLHVARRPGHDYAGVAALPSRSATAFCPPPIHTMAHAPVAASATRGTSASEKLPVASLMKPIT